MHITRNEKEKYVRAKLMRRSQVYQEYFTLREYGSWTKAERAAKGWLKTLLPKLPPPLPREGMMTRRNRSGVVGVYRSAGRITTRSGKEYSAPKWVARWPECPFRGGLSWSVTEFDEEGAFALAFISLQEKTVDRAKVLRRLEKLIETPKFDELLAQRPR